MIKPKKSSGKKQQFIVSEVNIVPYILDLAEYMDKSGVKLKPFPKVVLSSDSSHKNNPFGKTAYYSPDEQKVVLYTKGRHVKDVLRSCAHEFIHHNQNISGKFDDLNMQELENPRYAQENDKLKSLEEDAYSRGNMSFRAWEDQYK
jgi:hypothetical protein